MSRTSSAAVRRDPGFDLGASSAVVEAAAGSELTLRLASGATERVAAEDVAAGAEPAAGDRVLVVHDGDGRPHVVAAFVANRPRVLRLACGATVAVDQEAVELRDGAGHMLVRYAGGALELSTPDGDLSLAAPNGRVRLTAGTDLELSAARRLEQHAGHELRCAAGHDASESSLRLRASRAALAAPRLSLRGRHADVELEDGADVRGGRFLTTAQDVALHAERIEIEAVTIVEKARETLREVRELAETHVGRARTVVRDLFTLVSARTRLRSEKDTSVEGRRILLG